jgi:hypothetical protein
MVQGEIRPSGGHQLISERCRRLAGYWQGLRAGRERPSRADIDPADIIDLLPWFYIVDCIDPAESIIRLAGTALRTLYGMELTGRRTQELTPPQFRRTRQWRIQAAATQPCGMWFLREHSFATGLVDEIETLFLPITPGLPMLGQFIGVASSTTPAREWQSAYDPGILSAPGLYAFVDIGFGVPPGVEPPPEYPDVEA